MPDRLNHKIPDVNTLRVIVKSEDMGLHRRVFGMDVISGTFAHLRDQGWNVGFSDNSTGFYKGTTADITQNSYGNLYTLAQQDSNYEARALIYDIFESK